MEFRRSMPKDLKPGDKVYLYCRRYIHGVATVKDVHYGTSGQLATEYAHQGCIDRNVAQLYLYGGKRPGVIELENAYAGCFFWDGPVVQNFVYFNDKGTKREHRWDWLNYEAGEVGTEVPFEES